MLYVVLVLLLSQPPAEATLHAQAAELRDPLGRVKTLSGLIPICATARRL